MSNAIDRLEELEARATGGPWAFYDNETDERIDGKHHEGRISLRTTWEKTDQYGSVLPVFVAWLEQGIDNPADAALISALRNATKPLLAVVRAAERINADLAANGDNIVTDDDKESLRLALATLKEMPL